MTGYNLIFIYRIPNGSSDSLNNIQVYIGEKIFWNETRFKIVNFLLCINTILHFIQNFSNQIKNETNVQLKVWVAQFLRKCYCHRLNHLTFTEFMPLSFSDCSFILSSGKSGDLLLQMIIFVWRDDGQLALCCYHGVNVNRITLLPTARVLI